MPLLENPRHEAFARKVAGGCSASRAYREVYGCAVSTAEGKGPGLVKQPKVVARLEELRGMADVVATAEIQFTQQEAIRFLVEVIETPVGQVNEQSRLAQEVASTEGRTGGSSVRVKMPGKLEALKLLAGMCGWNAPEERRTKVSVVGPREVVRRLMSGG